jgi:hypothetical protein
MPQSTYTALGSPNDVSSPHSKRGQVSFHERDREALSFDLPALKTLQGAAGMRGRDGYVSDVIADFYFPDGVARQSAALAGECAGFLV